MDEPPAPAQAPLQADPPHQRSMASWGIRSALVLMVLYPLSIGPAAMVHSKFPPLRPTIELICRPLTFAADRCGPLGAALRWYIEVLWKT